MRFLTAGESHGPQLTAIIEGLPAGLALSTSDINAALHQRQKGYGRGQRMQIEKDQVRITSGVRHGKTLGSPVTLVVENKDWANWDSVMAVEAQPTNKQRRVSRPRPGHADLVGGMKYAHTDLRNVLERSSARETTMRVAIGAIATKILQEIDVTIIGHVRQIGEMRAESPDSLTLSQLKEQVTCSDLRMLDTADAPAFRAYIDQVRKKGDTLGGIVEVLAEGLPAGLGSYVHWDRKLDAKIAQAVLSIPAFKGVSFGLGFESGTQLGSQVMDEILWDSAQGFTRKTNHLGGFEGGMTNGMPLIIHGVMKPIPTLYRPLQSVDIDTKQPYQASVERSDTTAVPAASVICEAVVAIVLVEALFEKFPSDTFETFQNAVAAYRLTTKNY